jgi:hypothetical protein
MKKKPTLKQATLWMAVKNGMAHGYGRTPEEAYRDQINKRRLQRDALSIAGYANRELHLQERYSQHQAKAESDRAALLAELKRLQDELKSAHESVFTEKARLVAFKSESLKAAHKDHLSRAAQEWVLLGMAVFGTRDAAHAAKMMGPLPNPELRQDMTDAIAHVQERADSWARFVEDRNAQEEAIRASGQALPPNSPQHQANASKGEGATSGARTPEA